MGTGFALDLLFKGMFMKIFALILLISGFANAFPSDNPFVETEIAVLKNLVSRRETTADIEGSILIASDPSIIGKPCFISFQIRPAANTYLIVGSEHAALYASVHPEKSNTMLRRKSGETWTESHFEVTSKEHRTKTLISIETYDKRIELAEVTVLDRKGVTQQSFTCLSNAPLN